MTKNTEGALWILALGFMIATASLAIRLYAANDTIRLLRANAPAHSTDDALVHPETTKEVKWLRMTKPTQQALLEIYAEHMYECSKFQQENDRVTIGEAAILWLMKQQEVSDE